MKAQFSVEFMILVTINILIFISAIWSSSSLQDQIIRIRSDTEAKKLCDKIAFEINMAVKAGDGYERRFFVDKSFAGISDFEIVVYGYMVKIEWSQSSVYSQIATENITGSINKDWNLIENKNGEIVVT